MSELFNKKIVSKADQPIIFKEIVAFVKKDDRDFDYNEWKKNGSCVAVIGADFYSDRDKKNIFTFLIMTGSGKEKNKKDFEIMIKDIESIYDGNSAEAREILLKSFDNEYKNIRKIAAMFITDKVHEEHTELSDLFIKSIKENKGVMIFQNSDFEYIKDENGKIIDKTSVSFEDILKNKQNKDTLSENVSEESIFEDIFLEKFDIDKDHQHYDKIESFICDFFDKNKSGFRYEILKNDIEYDCKNGEMTAVVYKGEELIGLVNQSNMSYTPYVSWKIFNKDIFDTVLNELIKKSGVEKFVKHLVGKKESIVSYCNAKEFNENPLKFIEKNTSYYYEK